MPLFISAPEIIFIIFIVLMLFGADKIPEIARTLGKGMRQLKDATNDIKSEIQKSAEKSGIDTSVVDDIKKEINEVKEHIEDATGRIKRQ
ncbi:MAG: twin-arginine translocase TatA/TatE family subunit [Capnocytophaga sp.]|nr:twin-arginine translocase TatA/TatE family subunit [Capnocytophaga sp.]